MIKFCAIEHEGGNTRNVGVCRTVLESFIGKLSPSLAHRSCVMHQLVLAKVTHNFANNVSRECRKGALWIPRRQIEHEWPKRCTRANLGELRRSYVSLAGSSPPWFHYKKKNQRS